MRKGQSLCYFKKRLRKRKGVDFLHVTSIEVVLDLPRAGSYSDLLKLYVFEQIIASCGIRRILLATIP